MRDMTHYIPASFRERLHRLGQSDWCKFARNPRDEETLFQIDPEALTAADPSGRLRDHVLGIDPIRRKFTDDIELNYILVLSTYLIAKALATGPGLLVLDAATCRALHVVRIDVPPAAFTLPRPTLIFDFDADWCGELGFARDGLRYALLTQEERSPGVPMLFTSAAGCRGSCFYTYGLFGDQTFEEHRGASRAVTVNPSLAQYDSLRRVALNAALLARAVGLDQIGWCDPEAHAAHERMASSRDSEVRAHGEYLAGIDIRRYKFLRDVMPLVQDDGNGPPSWRHRVGPDGRPRPYLARPRQRDRVRGRFTGPEV